MERKLLNVISHVGDDGIFNKSAFVYDLSAAAKENSLNLPYWERIHFYSLIKIDDGWIIDARRGDNHVASFYDAQTEFDERESQVGLQLAQTLVDYPPGTLVVHVSPPGGKSAYAEGRIQVQLNQKVCGITHNICYGIPTPFLEEEHMNMGYCLIEVSEGKAPQTVEELRDRVFVVHPPEDVDPWDFISTIIPINHVWDRIKSGQVIAEFYQTNLLAQEATNETLREFPHTINSWDAIRFGAHAEMQMRHRGYHISGGSCGLSNIEILMSGLQHGRLINQNGTIVGPESYNGFPCPKEGCGKMIPSGLGLTKCPYCGLTKEEWAEKTGISCN